jgi:hypothetical protein
VIIIIAEIHVSKKDLEKSRHDEKERNTAFQLATGRSDEKMDKVASFFNHIHPIFTFMK